jgi:transcriptional regulator with XRE-family HTH domain
MNDSFIMLHDDSHSSPRTALAANLRRLRIARHLSLSELARTTAISKATLSGIERAQGNPTVDTLAALAGALGVSLAELLEATPAGAIQIVRAAPATAGAGFDRRMLETLQLDGTVEAFELRLPARHVHEPQPLPTGARKHVLVLRGKLIAGPVERISELGPGDYASFPADVRHLLETAREPAGALVLSCTPR